MENTFSIIKPDATKKRTEKIIKNVVNIKGLNPCICIALASIRDKKFSFFLIKILNF